MIPSRAGFVLQNLTHNQHSLEYGGDEEVSFVLVPTESYSLQFHGQEVWSQSEVPNWANPGLPLGPLEVCQLHLLYAKSLHA